MGFEDELIEDISGDYLASARFSDAEKAAMDWAEILTERHYRREPGKPDVASDAMDDLKKHYDDAQIVEITMVSGFFNFWNRFTDGLAIDIEDHPVMDLFKKSTAIDPDAYVAFMRDCWWREAPKS